MRNELFNIKVSLKIFCETVTFDDDKTGIVQSEEPDMFLSNGKANLDFIDNAHFVDIERWLELPANIVDYEDNPDFDNQIIQELLPHIVLTGFDVAKIGDLQAEWVEIEHVHKLELVGEDVKMRHYGLCQDMFAQEQQIDEDLTDYSVMLQDFGPNDQDVVQYKRAIQVKGQRILAQGLDAPDLSGAKTLSGKPALSDQESKALFTEIDEILEESNKKADDKMKNKNLVRELIDLRQKQDTLGMKAAGLFDKVKREKLYKADEMGKTFRGFCLLTGWHFTTVYDLIRVYNNPLVKDVYVEIGAAKAFKIAKAKCDNETTQDLIELAKEGATVKELTKAIKEAKCPGAPEERQEYTVETLQERKGELENKLAEVKAELKAVDNQLKALQPAKSKAKKSKVQKFGQLVATLRPFNGKNSTLDILNCVHIDNGTVSSTNLERQVIVKGIEAPNIDASVELASLKPLAKDELWGDWELAPRFKVVYWTKHKEYDHEHRQEIDTLFTDYDDAFEAGLDLDAGQEYLVTRFEIKESAKTVVTSNGKAIELQTLPVDDRPDPMEFKSETSQATFSLALLKELVATGLAAATDESRPVLCHVSLKNDGGQLRAEAADGYVLSQRNFPIDWTIDQDLLIQTDDLKEAAKLFDKFGVQEITLTVDTGKWQLAGQNGEIEVEIMGAQDPGEFPDIERIIPKSEGLLIANVKSQDLIKVTNEISDFYTSADLDKESFAIRRPNHDDKVLELVMGNSIFRVDAEIVYSDGEFDGVSLHPARLNQIVKSTNSTELTLRATTSTWPVKLDHESGTGVIMPMYHAE